MAIRLGLCCIFVNAPIKFRRTTAAHQLKFDRPAQLHNIADIIRHNGGALGDALKFCRDHQIGAFRINSQILPLITHPSVGYEIKELPGHANIIDTFRQCGEFARQHDIRLSFHPDQFVVIASPRAQVRKKSVAELVYQTMVADWVGADVINIHAGGAYGDKETSLRRLIAEIKKLPSNIKTRLTLENDDRTYSPADLLPVCRATGIPLTYDVHHHRCLPDTLSIAAATRQALVTWNREPLFHISSPLKRLEKGVDRRHADYIDIGDLPKSWRALDVTLDVEAKAKELAVAKLNKEMSI